MTAAIIQVVEPLSAEERDRFQYLEQKADAALIDLGEAWAEIRDRRYYRESYDSFEAYCKDRLNRTRRSVDYAIAASQIIKNLTENNCAQLPSSESQVRPLTNLLPEEQPVAWRRAVDAAGGAKPTASQVKSAVDAERSKRFEIEAQEYEELKAEYSDLGELNRDLFKGRTCYSFSAPEVTLRFWSLEEARAGRNAIADKIRAFQEKTSGGVATCHNCQHRMASQNDSTWICGAKPEDSHVYGADQDIAAEFGCLNYKRIIYGRIGTVKATPTPVAPAEQIERVNHEFYRGKSIQCFLNGSRTLEEWWDKSGRDDVAEIANKAKELRVLLQNLSVEADHRAGGRVEDVEAIAL